MIIHSALKFPIMINLVNLIIFIETFVMGHIFGIRVEKRKYFWVRLVSSFIVGGALVYCFPFARFDGFWAKWAYGSFMYFYILLIAILTTAVCYKGNIWNYIFLGVGGYASHHVRSTLEDFVLDVIGIGGEYNFYDWQRYISFFISVFLIFGTITLIWIKNKRFQTLINAKRVTIVSFIIIVIDILLSCFTMFPGALNGQTANYAINFYNLSTSTLALGIMFGMINQQNKDNEIAILDKIIQEQEKQYKISRDVIESISIKAHDLKHHINYMVEDKNYITDEEKEQINNEINTFNSIYKTNNEVIDVVLTSRAIRCEKHGIEMTCIIDGKLFNFMEKHELYALFENAIDNAIDAVRKNEDRAHRFIFISVRRLNNMVALHVENAYDGKKIIFKNGSLVTSSGDETNHGFGLKSINRIVEKYKGFMNINYQDNVFYLDVCFPIKLEKENDKNEDTNN